MFASYYITSNTIIHQCNTIPMIQHACSIEHRKEMLYISEYNIIIR